MGELISLDRERAIRRSARGAGVVRPSVAPTSVTPPPTSATPPPASVTSPPTSATPPPTSATPPPASVTPPPAGLRPVATPRAALRTPGSPSALRPAAGRDPLWREVSGGVLRAERRRQDRTLADVAGRAGMSVQHLSEMERGRKEASSEMLAAAAGALGLGLAEFVRRCALTMAGAGAGAGADADAGTDAGTAPTGPVLLAA